MISVSVWQLVLYVLAGVALGAVVAVLSFARGKQATGLLPASQTSDVVRDKAPDPAAALAAAATRHDKVASFLKNRVAKKRSVTVDEAAKCLDVSPRRIRRLLDDDALMAIPTPGGGRLVSAVSVLDMIARREVALAAGERPVVVSQEESVAEESVGELAKEPAKTTKLKPGPRQLYWYYVAGHDEPLASIRDALQVLGLSYKYTGWNDIPASIRKKMQRERVA